jgi:hypothetical protein
VVKAPEPVEENVFEQPEIDADKSFDQIVDEVIRGDWGVGQPRRLALAKAGYDPNEVQQEIVRRANSR